MNIEMLSIFSLAAMLLLLTGVQGAQVPLVQGLKWGLGSRDEQKDKTALQGRFSRTVANHIEAMMIFVPLMGLTLMLGIHNNWTELAAWLVIAGRMAFIPLYLGGVFFLRSFAYGTAMAGIFILIVQLLV